MANTVDYVLVAEPGCDVQACLAQLLADSYQETYAEAAPVETLADLVRTRYDVAREDGSRVCGVSVEFDEVDEVHVVVETFTAALTEAADVGVLHAVRFLDPFLRDEILGQMAVLFELEMKLREALTVIFLDTCEDGFYDLLKHAKLKTVEPVDTDHLRATCENEFFFLLFSAYTNAQDRAIPRSVDDLRRSIAESLDFDELKTRLSPRLQMRQSFEDFLASITTNVDSVEKMRNAIAHNRRAAHKVTQDYGVARPNLLESIEEFFQDLAVEVPTEAATVTSGDEAGNAEAVAD
jgi:hypothetical protein